MNDAKHTPGPWYADKAGTIVWGGTGVRLTIADAKCCGSMTRDEDMANARLIAAAPELLEVLYSMLNIEGPALLGARSGAWAGLDVQYHFDKIRAAIAKATTG